MKTAVLILAALVALLIVCSLEVFVAVVMSLQEKSDKRMVLCPVWDYEAPSYQFIITFNTRTNVEFTTEPQMGYSTC